MSTLINAIKVENETAIKFIPNPKRPGFKAHERYEKYSSAKTIAEYFELSEKKYSRADLRYDEEHGYLQIFDADGNQINQKETDADKQKPAAKKRTAKK